MRISAHYSHLNGLEFLEARKPNLLQELKDVIQDVDSENCKNKISKEKNKISKILYSPKDLNAEFKNNFSRKGWKPVQTNYWVCEDAKTNRKIMNLNEREQKFEILKNGFKPIRSKNQTDFFKQRVSVEVQFGKYSFISYDLFVKHMAFYVEDKIDVGIEIIPMKDLQCQMSSGPGYFEAELYNLIREGRGVPPVPLVLIGVSPND